MIMRVLIVCSKTKGKISPFISEQVEALNKLGVETDFFTIGSKGILGYIRHVPLLKKKIKMFAPDIIHAHYGLSGLLANLQRRVPVVTTYHGSDINNRKSYWFSQIAVILSRYNIFVSNGLAEKSRIKRKFKVIPCGVDDELFKPMPKQKSRKIIGLKRDKQYVLFSSSFDRQVKNYPLAKVAIEKLGGVELIELSGYSREEVKLLMNAADCCLLTSFTEGSPQFVKEAMLCNRPIVSTDVGDVKDLFNKVVGVYLCDYNVKDVVANIQKALEFDESTGRQRILDLEYSYSDIAKRIVKIYKEII